MTKTVLLLDTPWGAADIECGMLSTAGFNPIQDSSEKHSPDRIVELVEKHQPYALMTCFSAVDAAAMDAAANLEYIGRFGVGLDNVDVAYAEAKGIAAMNVTEYCLEEVSNQAVASVMAWNRKLFFYDCDMKAGKWVPDAHKLKRLSSQKIGVIGFGRIGNITVRKLESLGGVVQVHSIPEPDLAGLNAQAVDLETILAASDILILHVPLLPATKHLINQQVIAKTKQGVFIINVSRGGLVDNAALFDGLQSGQVGGAALDVFEDEPEPDPRIVTHANVIASPHIAYLSEEATVDLRRQATEKLILHCSD